MTDYYSYITKDNDRWDLIAIQVELQLKEYAGKIPEDEEEEKGLKKKE